MSRLVCFMLLFRLTLAAQSQDPAGLWLGELHTGPATLHLVLHAQKDGGILESVEQRASLPVRKLDIQGRTISLDVGVATFQGTLDPSGRRIDGTFKQGAVELPLTFQKVNRPQTPLPPFPYAQEEVVYAGAAGVRLAGTLTYPKSPGPFPAAFLIAGSGGHDRDESYMGHVPFLVLSDYLTRLGFAVLRVDQRGTGSSGGVFEHATYGDKVADALAGIEFLKARNQIDPARIGLIGHSEGCAIASLAAAKAKQVAFVVLMAGSGAPGDRVLLQQDSDSARASGVPEAKLNLDLEAQLYEVVRREKDLASAEKRMRELLGSAPDADQRIRAILSPTLRDLIAYDPAPVLRSLACPVLAITGSKDVQASARLNLPAISAALAEGATANWQVVEMPGLNHFFQTAATGAVAEYARIEETIAPVALDVIGTWLSRNLLRSSAREIVLTPSDTGRPVIGPALNSAPPGSVIRLRKGTYRETLTISKPVSLVADEGAVIDPSEPLHSPWQPAPSYGAGVYRAAADRLPASLFIDGKILAQVDCERKETAADGPWFWKTLLAAGAPRTGFHYIRGLWLYRRDERAIFVHLENNADPSPRTWSVIWTRNPVVTLRNTHDASIRGVTLAHGYNGAAITEGCLRCSVTHSKLGPWDKYGVMVRDGAAESLVEENEIFRDSYEDLTPVTIAGPGSTLSTSRDWYEVWQIHKLAGFYDRVGIAISLSGPNNRLHANRIHDVFDGIDLGDKEVETLDVPLADPGHDRGAEIWDNLIERAGDSGIEVGGPAVDVRIHHNILRKTHGGLRYKLPRIGPVFIYRNVLIDGSTNNIWYSMEDSPAEGYVYHNTVVGGGGAGLSYSSWDKYQNIGAPHWHYLNNLFVTPRGFFETRDKLIPVNFTADYNVVQGEGRPYPDDPARDTHSRYVSDVKLAPGFPPKPQPDSPAIDAGLDLSTYFHGKPLPGCEPGYFQGKAPDAGAFEIQ